jgi:hypothetical protein
LRQMIWAASIRALEHHYIRHRHCFQACPSTFASQGGWPSPRFLRQKRQCKRVSPLVCPPSQMSETEKPPHGGSQTMRASPQQGSAKPDKRGLKHTESSMPVLSKKTSKKKVIEPHVSEKPPSARKLKTSLTMSPSSPTKHSHDDSKSDKAQNELKPISPTVCPPNYNFSSSLGGPCLALYLRQPCNGHVRCVEK